MLALCELLSTMWLIINNYVERIESYVTDYYRQCVRYVDKWYVADD